ncbi:MAG: histidine phosphatase family protein [Gammaproteobacteria bacterium]|nr:histidine phosphatase family protein [Gammaproteobacteria bacterium]
MARLYLIRHAQSANNEIWDGSDHMAGRKPDPEITTIGHRQAETLAGHLAHPQAEPRQHPFGQAEEFHFGLTHVYCSLMTRSILTAEYIAAACELELHALSDIFEKFGIYDVDGDGNLQGLPGPGRDYFEQRFPRLGLPEEFNDEGWWSRPVENEAAFIARMQKVVNEFRQRLDQSDESIALVAHGDFIDQFVNELMGVVRHQPNYDNHWVANWAFHNTSISRIDFVNGSHNVVYMNRIDHLPNELVTW